MPRSAQARRSRLMAYILNVRERMIGERIGRYEIIRELGHGGMGTVYLARHTLIECYVAIKVLLPEFGSRQEIINRFFNEARAASAIRTPSTVEIYDFGYHNGSAYIVMEYLHGESLGDRLRNIGCLSQAQAVAIARKIALALASAHAADIVHRDLKPDNIVLVPDSAVPSGERVKLLDFGIAKLLGDCSLYAVQTQAGMLIGTPAYMSPEQCEGEGKIDQRSDLYALGCILFEMLCGNPPFVASSSAMVLVKHLLEDIPSLRALAPAVSPQLEALIYKLLSKDPDSRYPNASQVLADLDAIAAGAPRLASGSGVYRQVERPSPNPPLPQPSPTTVAGKHRSSKTKPGNKPRRRWLSSLTSLLPSRRAMS